MRELLITCGSSEASQRAVEACYVPAVRGAGWSGGMRVQRAEDEPVDATAFAGLLLAGGDDIHPRFWDETEAVHPAATPDEPRDLMELRGARQAWDAGLPILGICRGIQLLNVALGGSLIQDIPSHYLCATERHKCSQALPSVLSHRVQLAPDSRLAVVLGAEELAVNSRHHQAVGRVAQALRAVAWDAQTGSSTAPLIEGLEAREKQRWVLGVQWHPENLVGLEDAAGAAARGLFRAFAQALGAPW